MKNWASIAASKPWLKHATAALSPDSRASILTPAHAQAVLRWAMLLVGLPVALFILVAVAWPQPKPAVLKIPTAALWVEPLGSFPMTQANLEPLVQRVPDLRQAEWQSVTLPHSIELGADIDLPDDAPKARAWFRVQVPAELLTPAMLAKGSLALMGNRVMGGPWAVWMNGRLVQGNVADWRIGWNVPLRVTLPPMDAGSGQPVDVLVSVVYPTAKGFAMGSMFMGSAETIDLAWKARNFWQSDIASITSAIAAALLLMSFQLARGRRSEAVYGLLCANAIFWAASGFQFTHDFVGQDTLSFWYGWAVDASVNWIFVMCLLVSLELVSLPTPRIRVLLVLYARLTTLITIPLWHWDKSALLVQHLLNLAVYTSANLFLTWSIFRRPSPEGWVISAFNWIFFSICAHDVFCLTSQTHPDHIFIFQAGSIAIFAVFIYLTNRRYLETLDKAERHKEEMQVELDLQKKQIEAQLAVLHQFELEQRLAHQHNAIMQDLHDHVGSNLTTVLHRIHGEDVSPAETILLLQELEEDLRHINHAKLHEPPSLNLLLAELRGRHQRRLSQGSITLQWAVSPYLPETPLPFDTAQNLRALLNQAIANAVKHAKATTIRLSAKVVDDAVVLEVSDNGRGYDPLAVVNGRGLPGMQERASAIGAELTVDSSPGQGCIWHLHLKSESLHENLNIEG